MVRPARAESLPTPLEQIIDELKKQLASAVTNTEQWSRQTDLCVAALELVDQRSQPALWAALQGALGSILVKDPKGSRADNIEKAIKANEQALTVYTREAMPAQWAMATTNLAATLQDRIRGERGENLERAIALGEQVLTV